MKTAVVVSVLITALGFDPARAEDITWTGAGGDHSWNNSANWDKGRVPGATDNVTIPFGTPECRVSDNQRIAIGQLVNHGTISSPGLVSFSTEKSENYGAILAPGGGVCLSAASQNVNYGTVMGLSVYMRGEKIHNAADAVVSANSAVGQIIELVGLSEVVNLGRVVGGDARVGTCVSIECIGGNITNEGTIRAGNGLSGGLGGDVVIKAEHGTYDNKGTVRAGNGAGSGGGGRVSVVCEQAQNSDTVKAGDSESGLGGLVQFDVSDFMNFANIDPGVGPMGVGSLRIFSSTGELANYGSLGHKPDDNQRVGNVYLAGHFVTLNPAPSSYISADTLVAVGQNVAVRTVDPNGRIQADGVNRFYCLPGNGVLNLADVDTAGVNALGGNYVFADSVVPPAIGFELAFSPEPTLSGSDTTWVNAGITGLRAVDSAGGSDTLTVCITNFGTATRVVNYSVSSARGWLAPLSGTTATLYPLMSAYLKTTYAIPETAATGSRDSITAVLTADPGFADTSYGEVYCYSGEPMVSVMETRKAEGRTPNCGVTIVNSILHLPEVTSGERLARDACLLDISGRKVRDLHPGPNDMSRLAPGVYFVRVARDDGQMMSNKVIVTR